MNKFLAMFPAIAMLAQAAEGIFVKPGSGQDKFNFVLGAINFGITQALPDFKAVIHSPTETSINTAAGDAINLVVAGLKFAGKLNPPVTPIVNPLNTVTAGGK